MKYFLLLFTLIFFASCATPTVINVVGPTDNALTCNQLDTEIARANRYADDAKREKSLGTGTNVAALLFWFPGLYQTNVNVKEAVDAANRRSEHLSKLKLEKNCGNIIKKEEIKKINNPTNMGNQNIVNELKDLQDLFDAGALTKEEFTKAKNKLLK
tara:strand:+ start:485 stop:955 length:471 start_codon:yes stop_codon:yes gene_type:complete